MLADESEDAYERVVDRLLASPQYGERWGRHWMDVWRYSDWDGYGAEVRESQPHIWRWRDWIIESLNADKPYDEMVREMLAADEVAPGDPDTLRASGFLVRNWYKFNRNVWLEATVEHTSKAFLGITLNCARCHDHMYDPILQTDYYQFRAFFEPHNVRTDRVPGQRDTKLDGLVRVFDEKADATTYLFARGNEAKPDKEHPLTPGVPAVLGGDPLQVEPSCPDAVRVLPRATAGFAQQETLAAAEAAVDSSEQAMLKSNEALAAARKTLAEFLAAQPKPAAEAQAAAPATANTAPNADAEKPAEKPAEAKADGPSEAGLKTAIADAEVEANLAEQGVLAAAAELVAVRAKIAADNGAFANPPAANAAQLAREASRAEHVHAAQQRSASVARLEQELAKARAAGGDSDKAKKNIDERDQQAG